MKKKGNISHNNDNNNSKEHGQTFEAYFTQHKVQDLHGTPEDL